MNVKVPGHYFRTCGTQCRSWPACDGCNDYHYVTGTDSYVRETIERIWKEKENILMDCANARVVVGNRVYPATCVEYECSINEYPEVEVTAVLNPNRSIPFNTSFNTPTITNVIFNPPATIVFWSDKTKTVVKCDEAHELYDPEKGLAMAISRKMLGDNKREYYNTFLHWLKKWEKTRTLDDMYTEEEWNGEMYNV